MGHNFGGFPPVIPNRTAVRRTVRRRPA
jgi:hypothetical protein